MTFDMIGDHLKLLPATPISRLAPYSALILSIVLIVLFLIRFCILQRFLLEKIHGSTYTQMDDITQRSFLNHYIAGATEVVVLVVASYPFCSVIFGTAAFDTPYAPGSGVTMGDILLIAAQILSGMAIFELLYRIKTTPVSVIHHTASIMIAQTAITLSIKGETVSSIEFLLCTVWGAFDIVAQFIPHVTLILYRVYPTSHSFLANLFKVACLTTLIGTISETVLVMYMFGVLWHEWPLAFKIVTPLLHVVFSAAQLYGTRIFYKMWRNQEQQLKVERDCDNKC